MGDNYLTELYLFFFSIWWIYIPNWKSSLPSLLDRVLTPILQSYLPYLTDLSPLFARHISTFWQIYLPYFTELCPLIDKFIYFSPLFYRFTSLILQIYLPYFTEFSPLFNRFNFPSLTDLSTLYYRFISHI